MSSDLNFKPVTESAITYLKPEQVGDLENGVIGTYIGTVEQQTKFGIKTNYKLESEELGLVVINGAGNLGFQMEQVQPGKLVKIEYRGTSAMKKGPYKGTQAHNFVVSQAE